MMMAEAVGPQEYPYDENEIQLERSDKFGTRVVSLGPQ